MEKLSPTKLDPGAKKVGDHEPRYSFHLKVLFSVTSAVSLAHVLVFCSSHNRFPQTQWLEQICSLTVLEAESLKSKCGRGLSSSRSSRGGSFLASSSLWWLQVFLGLYPYPCSLCLCLHMSCPCVSVWPYSPVRALVIGFRGHRNSEWSHLKILRLIISAKTLFPGTFLVVQWLILQAPNTRGPRLASQLGN